MIDIDQNNRYSIQLRKRLCYQFICLFKRQSAFRDAGQIIRTGDPHDCITNARKFVELICKPTGDRRRNDRQDEDLNGVNIRDIFSGKFND